MIHNFSEKPTNTIIRKNSLRERERERKENLMITYALIYMAVAAPFVVVLIKWLQSLQ